MTCTPGYLDYIWPNDIKNLIGNILSMILITGNRQDHISNDSYQEKQVSFILPQSCHPATLGHLPGATRS